MEKHVKGSHQKCFFETLTLNIVLMAKEEQYLSYYPELRNELAAAIPKRTVFTLSIGTPYLLTILDLKFELLHSTIC